MKETNGGRAEFIASQNEATNETYRRQKKPIENATSL
jgi:hypothetical protein